MAIDFSATKNWNRKNIKEGYGKIHDRVLDISETGVETTVDNIEKWQKLFAKSVTASTPLIEKGIDLSFDVVETLATQYISGGKRMKSLLGLGNKKIQAKKLTAIKPQKEIKKTKSNNSNKLTDISGVGPKIASLLKASGINTIAELANAQMSTLEEVLAKAGKRFQMHDPKTWVAQANQLLAKNV